MENVVLSKINNNMFSVPFFFLNGNSSFVFTYVDFNTILVYPEENWSPQKLLVGVEINPLIYDKILDFICINSYVVKTKSNGKFQILSNFIGKLMFSSECYIVKTEYGFFISGTHEQKSLVLK